MSSSSAAARGEPVARWWRSSRRDEPIRVRRLERLEHDELVVQELLVGVEEERLAAGHPGAEVPPVAAENDDRPARHVLARVVADSLDDRGRARVPHREPLPGRAGAEEVAPRRAVEDRVPEQDGLAGVA